MPADKVIATGRAAYVVTITEIDSPKIGEGRIGSVPHKLRHVFEMTVKGKLTRSATRRFLF